jgi:hypothetical protein
VAPPFVLQGPGGEQEEQVVAVAVVDQPEVPHPGAGKPEHRSALHAGGGDAADELALEGKEHHQHRDPEGNILSIVQFPAT